MSDAINTLSLMTLDEARAYLREPDPTYNLAVTLLVKGVSARIQSAMNRRIRSRTWTHDGSVLPRLDSHGGSCIWLPNVPVTAMSVLKVDPDQGALTLGWNDDYEFDPFTGKVSLLNGSWFWNRPKVVEITYVGGYLDDADAGSVSEEYVWGYDDRSADIRLAALQQLKFEWDQWKNEDDGVASRSEEGVSVTFSQSELIPRVQAVVERYRFDARPVADYTGQVAGHAGGWR